ncbi:DoxX family protein [Ktedonospora formicarum]|uniref:DoxX family protein n=1 Tax=Ktedonospora formicarum TaxID=2778364 RepID=A0A8J3IBN9_9CHLR|nr:DoxX family protein [Ktedonospora formicarum]GHO49353.1 hypothetical protein KSX_75160 [Ktedonospora formicarum]
MELSLGLLIIRIVVGLLLIGHGSQKAFGWFGGGGFAGTVGFLKSIGFKPAGFWVLLGVSGEIIGGLLFLLGLLTPLGAAAIFASMLMAVIKMHWKAGLWSQNGGYEYPLVLAIVALAVGLIGPGSYSIDALLGFTLPTFIFWSLIVLSIIVDLVGRAISNQTSAAKEKQQAA